MTTALKMFLGIVACLDFIGAVQHLGASLGLWTATIAEWNIALLFLLAAMYMITLMVRRP